MGNKDKREDRHRSRSRDRVSHKSKRKKKKRSPSNSDESLSDSRSRSPVPKQRKKHKSRRKSSSDSVSPDKDSSGSDSTCTRSRPRRQKDDHHRRPRSRDRKRSRDRQKPRGDNAMQREEDVEQLREEMREQKELNKRFETPEEKRARRLAKKDVKERKRKAQMGWDQEYLGYTNADNPFGDEHLLETFMWQKKNEKEGKKDECINELHKQQKQKMEENRVELEKVKKRRLEREKEREARDQETEMMQRDKEAEYYREWEKQEDSFHLQQAKLRSKIRIQDGRAKPIDLLAKYISAEDDELAIEMHEPYTCLSGLTITDLEDLLEDIKVYLEMEQGKNVDYWRDIIIVAEDEIGKLKKIDPASREYLSDRREGINQSVSSEISNLFKGKTTNQLLLLECQINAKLKGGEGIDIGYWESLVQELKAHMARTRLRERHQEVLRQKLFKLKNEQGIQSAPLFPVMRESSEIPDDSAPNVKMEAPDVDSEPTAGPSNEGPDEPEIADAVITEADLNEDLYDEAAGYSPRLLKPDSLDIDSVIYNEEDDLKKLELARTQVRTTGKVKLDVETEFEKKAREGMNDDEAQFSVEVALDQQAFLWSDKYRPRKPRFFNRVHTGFEWNKYNQTHYDIDNPPPKIVQGYKFNIFYPDLIDKTETPEYTLTPIEGVRDFSTLKFHAGPPYEDIAFKVVNREWEYSYKRGFRCQFQNNIFQLWFHFKRYRYRR